MHTFVIRAVDLPKPSSDMLCCASCRTFQRLVELVGHKSFNITHLQRSIGLRLCDTTGHSITDSTASFLVISCTVSEVCLGVRENQTVYGNVQKRQDIFKLLMGSVGLLCPMSIRKVPQQTQCQSKALVWLTLRIGCQL